MPEMPPDLDLGHVKEGTVEIDPMTGRMVIRSETPNGMEYFDLQEAMTKYRGQEVRVMVVPFTTINRIAQLVEDGSLPLGNVPNAGGR
jgi:hypothetical protein